MKRLHSASLSVTVCVLVFLIFTTNANAAASDLPFRADETRPGIVRQWNQTFTSSTSFSALPLSAKGGGTLATGDLEGDGVEEIIVGAGPTAEPYVNIFNADGTKRHAFLAFEKTFRGGVNVAAADMNGDGKDEIIVAPGAGRAPMMRVFGEDGTPSHEALAYGTSFQGGVHLAVIDVTQDGKDEIVTSPGPTGGPHVRIWDGALTNIGMDFFAFDPSMRDGVSIGTMRTKNGPAILAAPESWSTPIVRRFGFAPAPILTKEFYAFDSDSKSGVTLTALDVDQDGTDEIATVQNGKTSPEVRVFDLYGTRMGAWLLHDPTYRGGMSIASYAHGTRLMTMPFAPVVRGPFDSETMIDVNLTAQRLSAFEHGRVARSFLISSGTYKYPTPTGSTQILKKIPIMDYRWSYGRNHPDNYNIKNVKFNLNVFPHIYIHTAYWHNNFGRRMSHGCINTHIVDAEWIYNWSSTGTRVDVHN
jgi:hypothetical protein